MDGLGFILVAKFSPFLFSRMYHVALAFNLSKSSGCFLQRLSANDPSFNAITMECSMTTGSRSLILIEMAAYISMNNLRDSLLA